MFFTLVYKKNQTKHIKSEKVLENIKTPNAKRFHAGHKGLLWERALRARLWESQRVSSGGWQAFCAEGNRRCLSAHAWT